MWVDCEVEGKGRARTRGLCLDRVRNPCSNGLWCSCVWWSWWKVDSSRSWHRLVNSMFTFSGMTNVTNCARFSSEAFEAIQYETVYMLMIAHRHQRSCSSVVSILQRWRRWVTLRLYNPNVPSIPITECILSSQAPGPAHEVRLERTWVDGGGIIIMHTELMVTMSSVSSNLRSWTLKAEGQLPITN